MQTSLRPSRLQLQLLCCQPVLFLQSHLKVQRLRLQTCAMHLQLHRSVFMLHWQPGGKLLLLMRKYGFSCRQGVANLLLQGVTNLLLQGSLICSCRGHYAIAGVTNLPPGNCSRAICPLTADRTPTQHTEHIYIWIRMKKGKDFKIMLSCF